MKDSFLEYKNKIWIKNFYYNRTSIQKLIFLFSFLKKEDFINVLNSRILDFDFTKSDQAKDLLLSFNDKLSNKAIIYDLPFGWLWIFDSHFIYYFKNDFDFDNFYEHFLKIENSENIYWHSAEFFDKSVKVLEIFKKNSFIRIYRDEEIFEKSAKVKKIKSKKIIINDKNSYFFLKNYDSKNIKLVFYFYRV